MPDGGTARADFPGGDAQCLWTSIVQILALPDEVRLFTGHDYRPGGREPQWESTVVAQRQNNIASLTRRNVSSSPTPRNHTAETKLAGWGGRIRTAKRQNCREMKT
jgi:glyoxylase-like metal-dependent hydrolase (beta-lactamase superfamily II)